MSHLSDLFAKHVAKKKFKALRNDFRLYAHRLDAETRQSLEAEFCAVHAFLKDNAISYAKARLDDLELRLEETLPSKRHNWLAENFDIIVSALAVAFCFRAYYYQPFKIPTGSMQPTLYGIHGETCSDPTIFDKQPLRFFKWCITGDTWENIRAQRGGTVLGWRQDIVPGYASCIIGNTINGPIHHYEVPDNIGHELAETTLKPGTQVRRGQVLWQGYTKSGDVLFVNRWIWNFRHPRLGETIVFTTDNITGLSSGMHYIKRLCGRPGDEVEIKPDSSFLYVNGEPVLDPPRMREIGEKAKPYPSAPNYLGYQSAQDPNAKTHFQLQPGEYIALGDNSGNSLDSRYWGTVPAANVLGPASFVHWPFTSPRWGNIQ